MKGLPRAGFLTLSLLLFPPEQVVIAFDFSLLNLYMSVACILFSPLLLSPHYFVSFIHNLLLHSSERKFRIAQQFLGNCTQTN